MIVTLTPNPALDRTLAVDVLRPGALHRGGAATEEASGKGVNVSRVLDTLGVASTCVLPLGGDTGDRLAALLAGITSGRVSVTAVRVGTSTRTNTTVVESGGRTTKFNEDGSPLAAADADALLSELARALGKQRSLTTPDDSVGPPGAARWLACCGSLPPGCPPELVARVVACARAAGARVVVDTSGPALEAARDAGADLLAPNSDELAQLTGGPPPGSADPGGSATRDRPHLAAVAVAGLDRDPGTAVLASLGAAGAVWAPAPRDGGPVLLARAPRVPVVNTVGAGDALLAGWLAARTTASGGGDPARALATAVATAADAVRYAGTAGLTVRRTAPEAVVVEQLTLR